MRALIYSCIGPLYIKIAEEKCDSDNIEEIKSKWKDACYIEFFDDKKERLITSVKL